MTVLHLQAARQEEDRRALGERWQEQGFVFTRGRLWLRKGKVAGGPLDPDRVSEAFGRDVARLGLPRIRLHDLRHTWATLALSSGGIDGKIVQERLGHASYTITSDIYTHVSRRMDREAAETVAALFTPSARQQHARHVHPPRQPGAGVAS